MRPITPEERQRLWNTLNQNMSYEGRLFTILSVDDELRKSDIDPTSLDVDLIEQIRGGLGYVSNIFLLDAQNIYRTGLLDHISINQVWAWYGQACNGLDVFDAWLKPTPSQDNHFIAPSILGDNQDNIRLAHTQRAQETNHDTQPQHKPSNTNKTITKTKLSNILHGNAGHVGYHTKSWFYYFFGCLCGLSNKRSGTIVALFALLDQKNESFEEQDIKNAIKFSRNYDTHALRRLSLFKGNGNKNGSSTDDVIEELKTAFVV